MRYLAIDHGQKRTGLAVCDPAETLASPLEVLTGGNLIRRICEVIEEYRIGEIIIGLPLNMDDSEGPRVKQVREFAESLTGKVTIPIRFYDERLSSFDAEQKLSGLDFTRKAKKKRLDALAAASILQAFLDEKSSKLRKNP